MNLMLNKERSKFDEKIYNRNCNDSVTNKFLSKDTVNKLLSLIDNEL